MCQPASKPWPLGTLRAVCTSGLIPQSLPSTLTPGRRNLLCPVSWTHCLLWTGARTCCLYPSSLSHSPLTHSSPIGLLPTLLQLPGCTSHLRQMEGMGWTDSVSDLSTFRLHFFLARSLGIEWANTTNYPTLTLSCILGEHLLWMQRFCAR